MKSSLQLKATLYKTQSLISQAPNLLQMITGTKILQINVNRSLPIIEHILQIATELSINIIAVQEPWIIQEPDFTYRSVIHSGFKQVLPNNAISAIRPRALFYISHKILATIAPLLPQDPDCIILDIPNSIQVINIYNARHPKLLENNTFI
jgi:uncharacterized protein (DUF2342 family)